MQWFLGVTWAELKEAVAFFAKRPQVLCGGASEVYKVIAVMVDERGI